MALAVHPRFGEEIAVVWRQGRHTVLVEMSDGRVRKLPVAWTTLHVRAEALSFKGQPVRLAPERLRELVAWVAARRPAETETCHAEQRVENPDLDGRVGDGAVGRAAQGGDVGVADSERFVPAGGVAGAVVGEAGSPEGDQRAGAERARGGGR